MDNEYNDYNDGNGQSGNSRDRLLDDIRRVMREAEELLRSTGQQAGEGYQAARERFESTLSTARHSISELEDHLAVTARETMESTDRYVKENPWQAVAVGALAGIALGVVVGISRRYRPARKDREFGED
ncbi:DUF883 family protein [Noviherbaspirillum aerium]|uniref:DUF883 family protein n=1 Tax=Noviherbaspirillum aerium TaxID=2588497 RepID=UPI00124EE75E|nr:DUF883 family protein [Noviherbaspirillum aerium]